MFLREAPSKTLADVREDLNKQGHPEAVAIQNNEIVVDLVKANIISLPRGKGKNIEVPATAEGVSALGDWLEIPSKFLGRLDADVQQHLLATLLERTPGSALAMVTKEALIEVRNPSDKYVEPRRLVDIAANVIDPAASVIDHWLDAKDFRLDVIAPESFDRGIGGDLKVGDLTRGGVRIGQDRKHNLAPWVQPYLYRLACTNGMETVDEGLKVDARGSSVDEVLAEFEAMADRAFRQVEDRIRALYDLRSQRIEHPERTMIRLAGERGLPDRTVRALTERIPSVVADDGSATMFDLVGLITNQANDPTIRRRAGARRTLEIAGGGVVVDHADRCKTCQSKLN